MSDIELAPTTTEPMLTHPAEGLGHGKDSLPATPMAVVVVIPAYKPTDALPTLVEDLVQSPLAAIIVVDDGSGPAFRPIFNQIKTSPRVILLRHAVNLGKGAALRTGLNAAAVACPDLVGAVTADADGQHLFKDILAVARKLIQQPHALIMGCRRFSANVPLRSRFGNLTTIAAMRALLGVKLSDTQTGLRGIPAALLPNLLRLRSAGYEFELDMLLINKYRGGRILEVPIDTVYLNNNQSSHFNPILDSARIYFTLLRFVLTSFATALLDYIIFLSALHFFGSSLLLAQALARTVALFLNYTAVRKIVFYSNRKHRQVFPRYLLLVIVSGFVSLGLINFLTQSMHLHVALAKLLAEGILFLANFALQRDFIFGAPSPDPYGERLAN